MDTKKTANIISEPTKIFPPVVSVLGHVDHGKTTLLDAMRKSDIASSEAGGITQRIGASEIEVMHENKKRMLTLIDTPGHEAFSNMRSYGVSAADLVLLVVASDDGVMPQTKESIQLIRESKLPFIVVFTKKDAPGANLEKAKQTVAREQILLEGVGGDAPYLAVSAVKKEGISELIDLIFLVYDMAGISKSETIDFTGVVIESWLDKRRGPLSTVVIKSGALSVGDTLFQEAEVGRARALVNSHGVQVKKSLPGDGVEILGISNVLQTGSVVYKISQKPEAVVVPAVSSPARFPMRLAGAELAAFLGEEGSMGGKLKIILKTGGKGELEAIKNSLPEGLIVVFEGQGEVNVSDVLLAKDFSAIIIGFNVQVTKEAKSVAESEGVLYRTYTVIYRLLEELADAAEGKLKPAERIFGEAQIVASFSGSDGNVMGVKVLSGRIAMGDKIKIMREGVEIGRSKISSLRRGKQEVKEVAKNLECGIMITPALDFLVSDMVLSCSN